MAHALDTSGRVECTGPACICHAAAWEQISPFAQGYIEALFASHSISRYRSDEDRTYSHGAFDMLAPETLARIIADCEARIAGLSPQSYPNATRLSVRDGHLFWQHRQEGVHSAFPPLTVQLGGDGKVRFAEAQKEA